MEAFSTVPEMLCPLNAKLDKKGQKNLKANCFRFSKYHKAKQVAEIQTDKFIWIIKIELLCVARTSIYSGKGCILFSVTTNTRSILPEGKLC